MLEGLQPVRTIAEGGEGRVVLAYDPSLKRWLAVKIVRLAPGARALGLTLLDRLSQYAQVMIGAFIAPILASGLSDDAPTAFRERFGLAEGLALYVVMPYVHGLPAHELAKGPLGFREALALFLAVQTCLESMHAKGLVHLDLKPSNVLVEVSGNVVLIDPLLTLVGGANPYAPPEQETAPGPACDRYALGKLVAAVWSGKYPTDPKEGFPELPEPPLALSGKERLAFEGFRRELRRLEEPGERKVGAILKLAGDLGVVNLPELLAPAVARSPFRGKGAEIEKAMGERDSPASGLGVTAGPRALGGAGAPGPLGGTAGTPGVTAGAPGGTATAGAASARPSERSEESLSPRTRWFLVAATLLAAGGPYFSWRWISARAPAPAAAPPAAAAPTSAAVSDATAPAGRNFGKILDPAYASFLGPEESFARGHGRWQTRIESAPERMYLELADHSETVWDAQKPPLGGFVKLQLGPELYTLWRIYAGDKERQDTFLIRDGTEIGEPTLAYERKAPDGTDEEAAANNRREWKKAQATPGRVFRWDQTVGVPTEIAAIAPGSKYLHVVKLTWKGAGRVVWNVIADPCDHPNMPLRTDSTAPITVADPLHLLAQEKLWACPAPGGALHVHALGYWSEY